MKRFFQERKKEIINLLIVILVVAVLTVALTFILSAFDVIYFDDGIKLNSKIFDSFRSSWYGWVIIILFQVLISSLLCFIPGTSMAFILLMQAMFDVPWQAFLIAFIGVVLSSMTMYLVGRFGGYKLCKKILGEKDCEKASELLNHKGAVYFPIMMLFPMFPDDALVMIAGTLKMSMKWFLPSIFIARGIGVATIVFGIKVIPYERFTTPWHWVIFVLLCIVVILLVFYLAYLFNKFLESRNNKREK